MADAYKQHYGIDTVAIMPSLNANLAKSPADGLTNAHELTVAIAGQLYAKDAWSAFLAALDSVNWRVGSRRVQLRVLGRNEIAQSPGRRIECLGWQDQASMIDILSTSDVLYCPYWFDPVYRKEAMQCFPSKLTTYAAAGRPILVHSPFYASPASFVETTHAGVCCNSLESDQIIRALSSIVESPATYRGFAASARAVFDEHLSSSRQHATFHRFLDLEATSRLPDDCPSCISHAA